MLCFITILYHDRQSTTTNSARLLLQLSSLGSAHYLCEGAAGKLELARGKLHAPLFSGTKVTHPPLPPTKVTHPLSANPHSR